MICTKAHKQRSGDHVHKQNDLSVPNLPQLPPPLPHMNVEVEGGRRGEKLPQSEHLSNPLPPSSFKHPTHHRGHSLVSTPLPGIILTPPPLSDYSALVVTHLSPLQVRAARAYQRPPHTGLWGGCHLATPQTWNPITAPSQSPRGQGVFTGEALLASKKLWRGEQEHSRPFDYDNGASLVASCQSVGPGRGEVCEVVYLEGGEHEGLCGTRR